MRLHAFLLVYYLTFATSQAPESAAQFQTRTVFQSAARASVLLNETDSAELSKALLDDPDEYYTILRQISERHQFRSN